MGRTTPNVLCFYLGECERGFWWQRWANVWTFANFDLMVWDILMFRWGSPVGAFCGFQRWPSFFSSTTTKYLSVHNALDMSYNLNAQAVTQHSVPRLIWPPATSYWVRNMESRLLVGMTWTQCCYDLWYYSLIVLQMAGLVIFSPGGPEYNSFPSCTTYCLGLERSRDRCLSRWTYGEIFRNFYLDQSDLWEVHWYIQNL